MQLLTVVQVAKMLGMTPRTIYRLQRSGEIPASIRIGPRAARWRQSDLEAFLNGSPTALEVPKT